MRIQAKVTDRTEAALRLHGMLRDKLIQEVPGLDDQTLADTLEGLTDLREILTELIRSALEDESLLGALSSRIDNMRSRQKRLTLRAQVKRAMALRAMVEADVKTVTEPDFSAFIRRASPVLEVLEEEKIPQEFWKPQPSKLDRHALLEALKSGVEVEGAAVSNSQVQLSVRTR